MWGTMFNLVQPVFNPFGAARTAYGEILPNMAINDLFGASWDPWDHFRWVQRGRTGPSIGEIQCSTLFNRCSTQIGQLRPSIAKYCQLWPKMAVFGGPLGPLGPFSIGPKGSNWPFHMWDTMFNPVQLVFNPNRAVRLSIAKYCQIWPKMANFGGPLRPQGPFLMGPKGLNWSLHMWDTMFNPVQPVFNPNRAARPVYGQILPNMAKNGCFLAIILFPVTETWTSRLNIQ